MTLQHKPHTEDDRVICMEASMRDMLKHGRKFERMRTDEPGIFVRKIPQSKDEPAYLAIEINPVDEKGYPIHKIGVIIRSQSDLDVIREILSQKRVDEVLRAIKRVNES
jgi:hypothetical protein